jgi:hypothetical protein
MGIGIVLVGVIVTCLPLIAAAQAAIPEDWLHAFVVLARSLGRPI